MDASPLRVGVLGQHISWIVSKCTAPWLPTQAAGKASMFDKNEPHKQSRVERYRVAAGESSADSPELRLWHRVPRAQLPDRPFKGQGDMVGSGRGEIK